VDRTEPRDTPAASSDINKIVRADYPDPIYIRLALKAQEAWRNNPLWSPFYHEPSMLFIDEISIGRDTFENFRKLGVEFDREILTPEAARNRFGKWFAYANWTDTPEAFYNKRVGWGDADGAI
jgi:sarcosine oxidase/L-pipecolate oxidase